jgi:DNA-binding MarR family transcriptional regulator
LDARAVLFVLTEKGETLKNKAQHLNYQFEKKWEKKLGASRYQNFRQMLKDLSMPDG